MTNLVCGACYFCFDTDRPHGSLVQCPDCGRSLTVEVQADPADLPNLLANLDVDALDAADAWEALAPEEKARKLGAPAWAYLDLSDTAGLPHYQALCRACGPVVWPSDTIDAEDETCACGQLALYLVPRATVVLTPTTPDGCIEIPADVDTLDDHDLDTVAGVL